ncbi:DUF3488 and transglutaminase-like domain-containing protein [Oscillatoria laete-virens NRMC-F 0139]|nr:DUF3488 and transglutaminase-like domain-containing protein [Oscillatoria laete-virens]MDL5054822.1 DUF3488 and transglutaminase-like domain-containing protein [Oscillatoria laete-virens NRMC-F 0139]
MSAPTPIPEFSPRKAFSSSSTLHDNLSGISALLIVWSYLGLCFTQALEWFTLAPGAVTTLLVLFFSNPLRKLRAGAWWIISLGIFAAVIAEYFVFKNFFFDAAMHLVFYLQLNRFCTARKTRDFVQLYALTFLPILGCTALTIDLSFILTIFVYAILTFAYLLILSAHTESSDEERRQPSGMINRHLAGLIGVSVIVLSVLTTILFLSIPRASFAMLFTNWNLRPGSGDTLSGFTDNIQWGQTEQIRLNFQKAFFAEFPEHTPIPADPYWRVVSLDKYTGNGWAISAEVAEEKKEHFIETIPLTVSDSLYAVSIYLEPNITRYLVLLPGYSQLRSPKPLPATFNKQNGSVSLRTLPSDVFSYKLYLSGKQHKSRRSPLNDQFRALYLNVPLSDPDRARLETLTASIIGDTQGMEQIAQIIQAYLRNQFSYSLDLDLPGKNDAIMHFLESSRKGHCEYFAGAMVLMLRTAGIPARMVTGYRGGEWNAASRYFTVRQSDAHAWVEAHNGHGWVQFDPTPATAFTRSLGWFDKIRQDITRVKDKLSFFWYQQIVNYNLRDQMALLKSFSLGRDSSARIRKPADIPVFLRNLFTREPSASGGSALSPWIPRAFALAIFSGILAIAILAFSIGRNGVKNPNQWRAREAVHIWENLKKTLIRRSAQITDADTPRQIFEKTRFLVEDQERYSSLVEDYIRLRFSPSTAPPSQINSFRIKASSVLEDMKKSRGMRKA